MLALVEVSPVFWVAFILGVLALLALDLGVLNRNSHEIRFKEALIWTGVWSALAVVFGLVLIPWMGSKISVEFFTGYFIELSLSMDNVFVIALIFAYFKVPRMYQHRVLFWGVLGALVMRGGMIWMGVELINRFDALLYVFGLILLFTGVKMLLSKEGELDPEQSFIVRLSRRLLPISPQFDGAKFTTVIQGRRILTPLSLVLLVVETSDLVFAVDSIPAIFGVTRNPFIVFTSNVFAILGLRSLYSVLAGAIGFFRYLKIGLSVVLLFIGVKMLIDPHDHAAKWYQYDIPDGLSLLVVVGIIGTSILASAVSAKRSGPGHGHSHGHGSKH